MGITPDGWLDWAERVPGPADKIYSQPSAASLYVPHSAVGYYGGWASRLFSTARTGFCRHGGVHLSLGGDYTPYAAASVHGWIAYDGSVTQHYPFTASCWASGVEFLNLNGIAFENEGGYDPHNEPLTDAQNDANIRIIKELVVMAGWTPRRPVDANDQTATLYEHHENVRWPGHLATACPSNRIPWGLWLSRLQGAAMSSQSVDRYNWWIVEAFDEQEVQLDLRLFETRTPDEAIVLMQQWCADNFPNTPVAFVSQPLLANRLAPGE